MDNSKYGSLSIIELKNELRKRNARISGRKAELVDRLDAYDRNADFGRVEKLDPDFYMILPDYDTYSDVNSDSPFHGLTMETVQAYFELFEKKFDNHFIQLYNDNFLICYRISIDSNPFTYIKGKCRAEMRKGVSYTVDLKITDEGSISEAQCECAAGMGPNAHCKHVGAVMYGAVMFAKQKFIKTEETCTQRLQTFHKCKRFKGSPMKSTDLHLPGADEFTTVNFDPRPEKFQNNPAYPDHFQNVWLNFPGVSKVPIFQTFTPANMMAVAHDHDYLKLTPEDHFLQTSFISHISNSQIEKIKHQTMGQGNNKTWKAERTKRLTSSMFGRICKCTERTDKRKLAQSLTVTKNIKSNAIEHGHKHESVAIKKFKNDHHKDVQASGLIICKDYPFLAASPDGIINEEELVEVKCPYVSRNKKISPTTVPYLKTNQEGKYFLDNNHDYFYQIQGQLLCTGAKSCILIVCLANNLTVNDIAYIQIKRDDTFIHEMLDKLEKFYTNFFKDAVLEKYYYKSYNDNEWKFDMTLNFSKRRYILHVEKVLTHSIQSIDLVK